MKIDYLYDQLHKIINENRFDTRLVLAMGSAYNVRLMQNYLKCYSLKFQAILDNSIALDGKWQGDLKTFLPEKILKPKKEQVLILVYSPQYSNQMKQQLEELGYEENKHFFIIDDFRQPSDSWEDFEEIKQATILGEEIYQDLKRKYGDDVHIFICRGATGDVFFNGLYLKEYVKKQKIDNYVLAGDAKGLKKISSLFEISQVEALDFLDAENLQQCYKFFEKKDLTDVFMWQGSLYFNRNRTRMHKNFNFLDTYTYYIYKGLVKREEWHMPKFWKLDQTLKEKYKQQGIVEGKTVIMAPFAYSVKNLPEWVWEEIALQLQKKGYRVYANINSQTEINPFQNIEEIFFPFSESEALLTYAGHFLALRSGLCDIVAMIPSHQVILYPEEMNPIDYGVHRSDAVFSGFEAMGYEVGHITELSSPMIVDIVNTRENGYSSEQEHHYYQELIEQVIEQFE